MSNFIYYSFTFSFLTFLSLSFATRSNAKNAAEWKPCRPAYYNMTTYWVTCGFAGSARKKKERNIGECGESVFVSVSVFSGTSETYFWNHPEFGATNVYKTGLFWIAISKVLFYFSYFVLFCVFSKFVKIVNTGFVQVISQVKYQYLFSNKKK